MELQKGDIIKSEWNDNFHYRVSYIIDNYGKYIISIEPIDLKEPFRNGSYENFIINKYVFEKHFKIIKKYTEK